MKVKQRDLVRAFVKHRTYGMVAKELGLSVPNVRERLMRIGIVSEFSAKYGKKSVKLAHNSTGAGRILSIASGFIDDLGFKIGDDLVCEITTDKTTKEKALRVVVSRAVG